MKNTSIKTAILASVLAVLIIGIAVMVLVVGASASASTNDLTSRLIDARVNQVHQRVQGYKPPRLRRSDRTGGCG